MKYWKTILHDIKIEIKNLPYNIENIIGWSKVLWNNFDWDHAYLLEILEYKLQKMKKYFETSGFIEKEEYDKMIEKISICLDACKQLRNTEYEDILYEKYYEKYPFHIDTWVDEQGRVVHGMKSMDGEERDCFLQTQELIDNKNKELRHQLFDTMRDNYDWWWD
jgi:hypothetical protein